jgi:hypothetical protein
MNKHERAALARHQYMAGFDNGLATANIIIKQFPDGFSKEVSTKIRKITDDARDHVINALIAGGVEKKYRRLFSKGFNFGLEKRYNEYAAECVIRATGAR